MNNDKLLPSPSVLITTDFSKSSMRAFPYAAYELRRRKAVGTLLHVLEEHFAISPFADAVTSPEAMERARSESLAEARSKISALAKGEFEGLSVTPVVSEEVGPPSEVISRYAAKHRFDRIVMAGHGEGFFERFLIGSVTEEVMRELPCELLIVPPESHAKGARPSLPFKRIAVTTDFSEPAATAVPAAVSEAQSADAEVVAVHVMQRLYAPALLSRTAGFGIEDATTMQAVYKKAIERKLAGFCEEIEYPKRSSRVLERSFSTADSICRFVAGEKIDLLVLAARGAGGRSRWIGRVAEQVIRRCPVPILVIPV